jgi:hypothetical protein
MPCVIEDDPPAQSLPPGENYQPSWIQMSRECVLQFTKGEMSLSTPINSNLRAVGHLVVHPKVQLHNSSNALQNLEVEDSKSWSMVLCIMEWWWLRGNN